MLLLTRNPTKDFYPERPTGAKDLSSKPQGGISMRRSIATTEGSGLVGKDLSSLRPYLLTSLPPGLLSASAQH